MELRKLVSRVPAWGWLSAVAVVGLMIGWVGHTSVATRELRAQERTIYDLEADLRQTKARLSSEERGRSDAEKKIARMSERQAEVADAEAEVLEREQAVTEREDAVALVEDRVAENSFGAGIHVVGADIKSGTYRTTDASGCYWARLSNGGGGFDAIIANDNVDGRATVTIASSDWGFESSSRCGTWTLVD